MGIQVKPRTILIAILLVGLYVVSTVFSYLYFTVSRVVEPSTEDQAEQYVGKFDLNPIPTPVEPTTYNILLLGYGGAGHPGGGLSDTLIVVHIDPDAKLVALISVPRDLWISLPADGGASNRKINNAYAQGGGELAKQAVSTVVGLPIGHFVSVSFDGFKEAIDILEGVEVDVPKTFDDYWYPVKGQENDPCGRTPEEIEAITATMSGFAGEKMFPCRYEHLHFDAGTVRMDGETALKFIRSRHSVQHGGDFARSERAIALLLGIKNKLLSLEAIANAIPFFNQLSHTLSADLDEEAIRVIISAIGNESEYDFSSIILSTENSLRLTSRGGQSVLVPKAGEGEWESIQEFISEELRKAREGNNESSQLEGQPQ